MPSSVRPSDVRAARAALRAKGRPSTGVRLETIAEGSSVQMLHVGAYGDEPRTIARMDAFAHAHRLRLRGRHHEIYLSDPRRVPPARLRTILRHPVTARTRTG
ncbi:MAG TPA: GyrI-like domain-containing protein [Patescibacteria group bacterium]|nr:GyrI-like domain-containing protein [Patescibacteria group bacterium]